MTTLESPHASPAAPHVSEEVRKGQSIYTPLSLGIYDLWVLGFSNTFLWRCPTSRILALYAQHLSDDHLEVGVGTAFMLDKSRFQTSTPRVTLLDLNPHTLHYGARRLRRLRPETRVANVLAPMTFDRQHRSAAMNYLLHCLPGRMAEKAAAFDHVKQGIASGGRIFGATLLGRGVSLSGPARRLMELYNRKGIFSNREDDLPSLHQALGSRFERYDIELVGCAALFVAHC